MGDIDSTILIFRYLIFGAFAIMFILIAAVVYISRPKKETSDLSEDSGSSEEEEKKKKPLEEYGKFHGVMRKEDIREFMDFDTIVDDMIVRKKQKQFVMVIQCNGINFDLMSEQEKISVEEGFVQFLNTLRFPIQLYVQSRTLNLREIIEKYKSRVETLSDEIKKLDIKIAQANTQGDRALKEKLNFEKRRKENVLEYGVDITDYVERLSSNKNILQQKTYVVLSYYSAEIGGNVDNYSKEEIYGMCFSELYTRCQNIASALATCQVSCKILDSEELAELLYIAYNRDEAELYQLAKALDSQFDALYSTGKDVIEKQQERLDREINATALDLATSSIIKADKIKQQEELRIQLDKDQKVKTKAMELLDNYENQLDPRTYQLAKNQVEIEMDPIIQQDRMNIAGKAVQDQNETKRIVTKKSENPTPNANPNVQQNMNQQNMNSQNPGVNVMNNNMGQNMNNVGNN
jgi:hypothetical protein